MNEQKLCKGKEVGEVVYGFRYAHPRDNRSLFLLWKLFNSPAHSHYPCSFRMMASDFLRKERMKPSYTLKTPSRIRAMPAQTRPGRNLPAQRSCPQPGL